MRSKDKQRIRALKAGELGSYAGGGGQRSEIDGRSLRHNPVAGRLLAEGLAAMGDNHLVRYFRPNLQAMEVEFAKNAGDNEIREMLRSHYIESILIQCVGTIIGQIYKDNFQLLPKPRRVVPPAAFEHSKD